MNRKEKEVKNIEDIINIIKKCEVCRIALFDDEYPYIIPLNFGYFYDKDSQKLELYFHGANTGKKLDIIKNKNKAGFEMDVYLDVTKKDSPCSYTMEFESICGNGEIEILSEKEKLKGLRYIMKQYTEKSFNDDDFKLKAVNSTTVFRLEVKEISGKSSFINKN